MRNYKKLVDIFPDVFAGNGIFTALDAFEVPWSNDMDGATLDTEYFYNISGQKYYSPLVKKLLDTAETLSTANVTTLANVIYKMYAKTWVKEYATLSTEYNPISNYDMTETETASGTTSKTTNNTGTQTIADTGTQSTTHTGTQTIADTGTQSTTHTGTQGNTSTETGTTTTTNDTENDVFGFNSSGAVGDTVSEMNTTASRTDGITATRTDNLTDARTDNLNHQRTDSLSDARTDNLNHQRTDNLTETGTGSHSDSRTLSRSGNIGVTTTQQMLQSERELWIWNFFYNIVFPDVDRVLTIATYGNRWNIGN